MAVIPRCGTTTVTVSDHGRNKREREGDYETASEMLESFIVHATKLICQQETFDLLVEIRDRDTERESNQ